MESANSTVGKMENSSASEKEEMKISEKETSMSGNQMSSMRVLWVEEMLGKEEEQKEN